MNRERYNLLHHGGNTPREAQAFAESGKPWPKLTAAERAEGWHFCGEFDGLLVGPTMLDEWETCHHAGVPCYEAWQT